jgi:DNA-binding PadR family transcriptional regulator
MRDPDSLTELEGASLAVIQDEGGCTAYTVKERFRQSPSDVWSGSAGAIYPLMRRLEQAGLIVSSTDKADGRARRTYETTEAGKEALSTWLYDPLKAAGEGFDPLRARLFFSDLFEPEALRSFIQETSQLIGNSPRAKAGDEDKIVKIQKIWIELRQKALAEISEILVEDEKNSKN